MNLIGPDGPSQPVLHLSEGIMNVLENDSSNNR